MSSIIPAPLFTPPVASLGMANVQHRPLGVTVAGSGFAITANLLYAQPFAVARPLTFTKLGANVTDATAAGNFRRGIYLDRGGGTGGPGLLVVDSGDIAVDGTGEKIGTVSAVTLVPHALYWQVFVASAAPSFSVATLGVSALGNVDVANQITRIHRVFTYASLPADESAQSYSISASSTPYMWIEQ